MHSVPRFSLPTVAALACSVAALLPQVSQAQTTATTDPVGFITLDVAGAPTAGSNTLSFKALGLTRPVEYQGSAETVGTNSLTDGQATWTDNQFNGAAGAYYLEITSGLGAGTTYDIASTSASTKTLTLAQNLSNAVANGVTFKVRKHWTIGAVLGPNNESGLAGGSSSASDQVLVWNGSGYDIYYYQTTGLGGVGWRKGGAPAADASSAVLYPDDGLIVKRQQAGAVNVVLLGAVKTGQSSIPVSTGTNVIGNVFAAPVTLQSSGIYTGNTSTGLAGGTSSSADQLLLWNGTGYDIYYYQTEGAGGTGWRKVGDPVVDASATQIPVGQAFVVKRNAATAFDWVMPQHPATL